MALLQISEPGQSQAPHEHRLAVGIDLGTTNSLVATVRSGAATVLPDANGRPLLPSIVRYLAQGSLTRSRPSVAPRRHPVRQRPGIPSRPAGTTNATNPP